MSKDNFNPYVGLRPFLSEENLLFFGRDEQTLDILQRLHKNRFVAVVGSSGCGKSSLIRAGLIPALRGGYLVEDRSKWRISVLKPGQNPMYKLAEAILIQIEQRKLAETEILDFVIKIKKEGVNAILNRIESDQKYQNINFFLLVDQFEELFRFTMEQKDAAKKTEALDFVNMMLNLSKQSRFPFHVVLTMRSDFIGDCEQFFGLPEALNRSQYLVPRLNRQQLKMVIEGPAKLYGGKFNPALTSHLLNELGKVKDELPLLQHALMRIWDFEVNEDKNGELDLEDYKKIGGFEKALSNHADEALQGMSDVEKKFTKKLFQSLTTIDEDGRKIRRPVHLSHLQKLTGGTEEQLLNIIDHFIKDKRSFLIINKAADSEDKIIDISHESLIRQWDTLSKWVDEEGESKSNYLHLVESSNLQKRGKKDFLTGSELQLALEWRDKFKPTAIWADRYKKGFEECMAYLSTSNKKKVRKQIQRSLIVAGFVSLLIVAVGALYFTIISNELKNKAIQQTYIAEEQKEIALKYSEELKEQKEIAVNKTEETLVQKVKADLALSEAEKQKEIADNKTKEALIQKEKAEKALSEAEKQKEIADTKTKEALNQKEKADSALKLVIYQKEVVERQTQIAMDSSLAAREQRNLANTNLEKFQELSKTLIGAKYQGGIVFYWNDKKGEKGLIAAEKDFDSIYTWNEAKEACEDYSVTVDGITYDDWRLPTKEELNALYVSRVTVGGFDSKYYWGFNEDKYNNASRQDFGNGSHDGGSKNSTAKVRAIRAF